MVYSSRKRVIIITALLFSISLAGNVIGNCLTNSFSKKIEGSKEKANTFSAIEFFVCVIAYFIILLNQSVSLYTVVLGLLYGLATAFSKYYLIRALSIGPMHLTLLITTSSMLIPTLSGIFFGEKFKVLKLLVALCLIFFVYLSFNKTKSEKFNKKWFLFCLIAFICSGTIGVLQKIHQNSTYKGELGGFLFVSFVCAVMVSIGKNKGKLCLRTFGKFGIIVAAICGLGTFAANIINLKLSGVIPSQLFFPLINGGSIIINSICSVVIFKEKLNLRQAIGLIGGIVCLILICIV